MTAIGDGLATTTSLGTKGDRADQIAGARSAFLQAIAREYGYAARDIAAKTLGDGKDPRIRILLFSLKTGPKPWVWCWRMGASFWGRLWWQPRDMLLRRRAWCVSPAAVVSPNSIIVLREWDVKPGTSGTIRPTGWFSLLSIFRPHDSVPTRRSLFPSDDYADSIDGKKDWFWSYGSCGNAINRMYLQFWKTERAFLGGIVPIRPL